MSRRSASSLAAGGLLLAVLGLTLGAQAPRSLERRPPAGRRLELPVGELFVREGCRPVGGKVDLIVHLHGAGWVVQQALAELRWNAVLVTVVKPGLSSAYDRAFAAPESFGDLLRAARRALEECEGFEGVRWGHLVLSSFSAGYGGVRRILGRPRDVARIDALLLADSLHAGEDAEGKPRADQMKGFRAWARRAAKGETILWSTHSAIDPGSYASTTETNDDLLRAAGAVRRRTEGRNAWGMELATRVDVGGLFVRGYAGTTGADHMRHLWFLAEPLEEIRKRLR